MKTKVRLTRKIPKIPVIMACDEVAGDPRACCLDNSVSADWLPRWILCRRGDLLMSDKYFDERNRIVTAGELNKRDRMRITGLVVGAMALTVVVCVVLIRGMKTLPEITASSIPAAIDYLPRVPIDTAGYSTIEGNFNWQRDTTLAEISDAWKAVGGQTLKHLDDALADDKNQAAEAQFILLLSKASVLNYEGDPKNAYQVLERARSLAQHGELRRRGLYTAIFFQGVTALRRGENENCIMCRGESSCILPISSAARHTNPEGSRLAIKHFTEYLEQFPEDLEVRWLLNLAHMTLGEHPAQVDPRFLLDLGRFQKSEFDIGKFRDIGHIVGVNRLNQAGGAIMEDFDNDGLLDIAVTTFDPTTPMQILRNTGSGVFEDRTSQAGVSHQLGGLNCVQTDYNNDGLMDIYIVRGAWLQDPVRTTLLRNDGNFTFTDVTEQAGLLDPVNSISASWADYDNDGWLDLFVCCERQSSRLYRNRKDGTFEELSTQAGLTGDVGCKGAAWIDHDNDGYPDLFLNFLPPSHGARFYQNNRDGTFTDASSSNGIEGPFWGFSCWAFDYDNDGWLDLFATSYHRALGEVVKGIMGIPHSLNSNCLYHNEQGKGFKDVTKEAGLDMVFSTMGSNFADFDNDGFLDMYLGTGDPDFTTLVPNRMFRNVTGSRFSEITASAGTGNLQKGHGVACGDWDRDGNVDVFIEMGGTVKGDMYHNILFQNPGHSNNWLTVKLTGKKSNRAAIGARIKIITAGDQPQTFYRHVSSGSSFGGNPLQQTIGLGKADRIALLEIHWPTSGTTQQFRDIAVDQAIAVTEYDEDYQRLNWQPISVPNSDPAAKVNAD